MSKTKHIQCGLRLPIELKLWVDNKAKLEKRSFNNFIEAKLSQMKEAEEKPSEQKAA